MLAMTLVIKGKQIIEMTSRLMIQNDECRI